MNGLMFPGSFIQEKTKNRCHLEKKDLIMTRNTSSNGFMISCEIVRIKQ